MNSFYKEQRELLHKLAATIDKIDVTERVASELGKQGGTMDKVFLEAAKFNLDALQTEFALISTTIMQNFCNKMGFILKKREQLEEAEVIS